MKVAVLITRLLFGGLFVVFGLNHFLGFLEQPEPSPGAQEFWTGLGYLPTLIHGTELACGALIAIGLLVPLALIVVTPVVVNILAYHLLVEPVGVEPAGLAIAGAVVVLELFLVYAYRKHFLGLLNPFAQPAVRKRIDT